MDIYNEAIGKFSFLVYISECIGCGVCEKVCPVKNIKVVDKIPQWENKCANYLACFHWCPKKAVVINKFLMERNKHHHPEISLMDMDLRNSSYGQ